MNQYGREVDGACPNGGGSDRKTPRAILLGKKDFTVVVFVPRDFRGHTYTTTTTHDYCTPPRHIKKPVPGIS